MRNKIVVFSYFSNKTYVVGAQKNRLNETVLSSTQNKCQNWWIRKYLQFYVDSYSFFNEHNALRVIIMAP